MQLFEKSIYTRYFATGALAGMLLIVLLIPILKQPSKQPDPIYIEQRPVVDNIIQSETIEVSEDQIDDILTRLLGKQDAQEIIRYVDRISYIDRIVSVGEVTTTTQSSTQQATVAPGEPLDMPIAMTFEGVTVPVGELTVDLPEVTLDMWANTLTLVAVNTELENGGISSIYGLSLTNHTGTYELPIESTTYYVPAPVEERTYFDWWDPKLSLGIGYAPIVGGVGGQFSFSPFTYYKLSDPLFRFLDLGLFYGSEQEPMLWLAPFTYNLGFHMPLVDDLWLGLAPARSLGKWGALLYVSTTL